MRQARIRRETKDTLVEVELTIEGRGHSVIELPIGFLTHLLEAFCKHGLFDITMSAEGDLDVDQHHLVEDVGAALGEAFDSALGDRIGINRAGFFIFPMDESVAFVAVDICDRPLLKYKVEFSSPTLGQLQADLLYDFFHAFCRHLGCTLHIWVPYGRSDHHKAEAIFKGFGKAMRMACSTDPRDVQELPTTRPRF